MLGDVEKICDELSSSRALSSTKEAQSGKRFSVMN